MPTTSRSEYHQDETLKTLKNRITWSAIFAGIVLALAIEALFNLLGLGLGLSAFTPDPDTLANLGVGSVIWLIISGIISMFIGGWVAGKLSGIEGTLHGLVVWGFATLLIFMLITTTTGAIISGTANMIGKGVSLTSQAAVTLGKGATQIAPQLTDTAQNIIPDLTPVLNQIKQQANQVLSQDGENTTDQLSNSLEKTKAQLGQALTDLLNAKNENATALARQKLVNLLVQNANMDKQQAEQTVNNWQQNYQDMKAQLTQKAERAKQKALEVTEKTSNAIGAIAMATFFAFLISAIASGLGGWLGVRSSRRSWNL